MIVDQTKGVRRMKMISATICNNKIMWMNLVPYDRKEFEHEDGYNGKVYATATNGTEMVIDRYGASDTIVDVLIKTDSITTALMAIFEILGENGIDNL